MSETASTPGVPLTIEGASILHQMFRVNWPAWNRLHDAQRRPIIDEAAVKFTELERCSEGQTAFFSMLGHKGDIMAVHFRNSFDALNEAELRLSSLTVAEYLEPVNSYLSVIELGLYESTVKLHAAMKEKGIQPGTPEWDKAAEEVLDQQRKAMHPRLYPEIPPRRYLCFYPMNKRRGQHKNWYMAPMDERQRMMREHGGIGRKYADSVKQIISGSIGFDDWEWGVDLFADDPLVFKRLIYEMRFDEASAVYALFGMFFVGLRFEGADIGTLLSGRSPSFRPAAQPAT